MAVSREHVQALHLADLLVEETASLQLLQEQGVLPREDVFQQC